MKPKVSVIVTTFNREILLKKTLESILSQTFQDFELVVVDNNSQYDFISFVEAFNDERIRPFQNQNAGVIAINRNYGIRKANGEYIALCDDDDLWEPDKLQKQVDFMMTNPSADMCSTDVSFIDAAIQKDLLGRIFATIRNNLLGLNIIPAKYLLISFSYITNSSVLFRRQIIDSIGCLNEDPLFKAFEDFEFWFRMSNAGRLCYINEKLVQYRVHNHQVSSGNMHEIHLRTLQIIADFWPSLNSFQKLIYHTRKWILSFR